VIDTKKHKTSSDGKKFRFEWKDLGRNSSSKISATVSNDFGSVDASTELIIKRKPQITQKLKPVATSYGETAEFSVKVDSYPNPKVKVRVLILPKCCYKYCGDMGLFLLNLWLIFPVVPWGCDDRWEKIWGRWKYV